MSQYPSFHIGCDIATPKRKMNTKEMESQNLMVGHDSNPQNVEDSEKYEATSLPEETIIALICLGQILRKINARMLEARYNINDGKLTKNENNDQ